LHILCPVWRSQLQDLTRLQAFLSKSAWLLEWHCLRRWLNHASFDPVVLFHSARWATSGGSVVSTPARCNYVLWIFSSTASLGRPGGLNSHFSYETVGLPTTMDRIGSTSKLLIIAGCRGRPWPLTALCPYTALWGSIEMPRQIK
jgi:hypothetical protein